MKRAGPRQTGGHGFDSLLLAVESAYQQTVQRQMLRDLLGNRRGRFCDFDMTAGFTPDIEQDFVEAFHANSRGKEVAKLGFRGSRHISRYASKCNG